jgi:small subunit ribosomal protein S1
MVNRNLIRTLEDTDLVAELEEIFGGDTENTILDNAINSDGNFDVNAIVQGQVISITDGVVLIDVGAKSEGTISISEWDPGEEQPTVGSSVQVLIEEVEDELGPANDPHGLVTLSKRKAEKILAWTAMMEQIDEGQIVKGFATRKIKGGLLVDIGVNVFLPASQVDIRRPHDIADYIGQELECEVLKIDEARRNIVVSRRSLIERQRKADREALLSTLNEGESKVGIVKNIADFGAFVDLGGIDGLLHITDMSWERIGHPTEMVTIDQEIEVLILRIDHEKEKIALGLKQKTPNPWDGVEERYEIGAKVQGEVVNVMSYGVFVKLEPGIEGLVHISEMSWTKRINHPNEIVQIGDEIEIVVLSVNREGQQLSLGIKQTLSNPWTEVEAKYPVDAVVMGSVRNLTNYGAFIELEEGIDGLLHVSDISWTRKISHPNEVLEKGQEIECKVLSTDIDRRRIALGVKQLDSDPWETDIPERYQPGQKLSGKVTKITNFGVFISLEDGLEGLLHISELADEKIENPEDLVSVGDELEVKVLRVDIEDRKIGLSRKRVDWEDDGIEGDNAIRPDQFLPNDLKGGLGNAGPLFTDAPEEEAAAAPEEEAAAAPEEEAADAPEEEAADAPEEEATDAPEEAADAPEEAADAPEEAADAPEEAADAPEEEAADAPEEEAADAPEEEAADAPEEAADAPEEAANAPEEEAADSDESDE